MNKNIFGDPLITCSHKPLTGYFRNGCCDTDDTDLGMHTVCIIATKEFLKFSKEAGNDLTTHCQSLVLMVLKLETAGVYVHYVGKKLFKITVLQWLF